MLDRGDDERAEPKGGEDEEREREVKVKNGGKENTEERRLRSSGWASHNVGPLSLPNQSPPSSASIALSLRTRIFHFNKANPS